MVSTHAQWLADCADRCVTEVQSRGLVADWRYYANVAHQIAQARPDELRDFVMAYPFEKAIVIAPLMVLAWRVVGNEFRAALSGQASEQIRRLCDIDEWENAVAAFAYPTPAGPGPDCPAAAELARSLEEA